MTSTLRFALLSADLHPQAPPKTATLEEIMNREEEDESLAKYKATLLAGAKDASTSARGPGQ